MTAKTVHNSIFPVFPQDAIASIRQRNGSCKTLEKFIKNLPPKAADLSTLMNVAATLARQGDTVRASHFLSLFRTNLNKVNLQLHWPRWAKLF